MKASCSQGNDSVVLLSFIWESTGCFFVVCFLFFSLWLPWNFLFYFILFFTFGESEKGKLRMDCMLS